MTTMQILEALGSFVAGLVGRFGLFLVAAFALALPAVVLALVWTALDRSRTRSELSLLARVAPNHTWLERTRRGALRVGVDEIAQRILPSATAVELPARGMVVHRNDPIVVIRAGRRVVRVGSPVDGTIVAVNPRVRRNPALVKDAPYGSGWLFDIRPADSHWRSLPVGVSADTFILSERQRLQHFVEQELGLQAADGGELLGPAPALLGEEGWNRVVSAFLAA